MADERAYDAVPRSQSTQPMPAAIPPSPTQFRRHGRDRRPSAPEQLDEHAPLLRPSRSRVRVQSPYGGGTPKPPTLSRNHSYLGASSPFSSSAAPSLTWRCPHSPRPSPPRAGGSAAPRHHSRQPSFGQRLIQALTDRQQSLTESKHSLLPDERVWYDQFTSTDWVHDSIADAYRLKELRSRKDFWGQFYTLFDGAQGWILSALVGFLVAVVAYCVDVAETTIFDYKDGYCSRAWFLREKVCVSLSPSAGRGSASTLLIGGISDVAPMGHVPTGRAGPRSSVVVRSGRMGRNSPSISLPSPSFRALLACLPS